MNSPHLALKLGLSLLAVVSCASQAPEVKPKRVSLLPVQVDVESLLPDVKEPTVPVDDLDHFPSVPVDENAEVCYPQEAGNKEPVCTQVPAGILVSERTYASGAVADSEARRFKVEADTLRTLRAKEWKAVRQAETAYQDTVAELQTQNLQLQQRSWWEENAFGVGLVCGIAGTVALTFAVAEATSE